MCLWNTPRRLARRLRAVVESRDAEAGISVDAGRATLLGDLPAVGRLFRSTGEGAAKRNLLIFVTASLVSPGGGPQRLIARAAAGRSDSGAGETSAGAAR